MANNAATLHAQAHPAPHRSRVGALALMFATIGGPLAWGAHLVANYAIASHACFPGAVPRTASPPDAEALWGLLVAIDVAAMVIAALAAVVSYRSWNSTRRELSGHAGDLIEIGEGRTRFLSVWGMLISVGFLIAIASDLVALWVLPLCG